MSECLVVGLSRFARRRVLPALAELPELTAVHVASRSAADADLAAVPKRGRAFRDYDEALAAIAAPALVYISLTNDAHARWCETALERGHHVVVDKPAVTTLADAERLVALAGARGCVLAEATTYAFHPLWARVREVFSAHGSAPAIATAVFTPPVPATDRRHRRALGGGALMDVGPYCMSLGRVLWGTPPRTVTATVTASADVDLAFAALADYGDGRAVVGHFGFTTAYRNWLHVAGPGLGVELRGQFSTPPDVSTELAIDAGGALTTVHVPPAFAMRLFLAEVLAAIARGDTATLAGTLLADARALDQLVSACRTR
jgi:dTDP-3,4-didehydro-2,6-dideoxy-alpha-D-glucose 3-reductase